MAQLQWMACGCITEQQIFYLVRHRNIFVSDTRAPHGEEEQCQAAGLCTIIFKSVDWSVDAPFRVSNFIFWHAADACSIADCIELVIDSMTPLQHTIDRCGFRVQVKRVCRDYAAERSPVRHNVDRGYAISLHAHVRLYDPSAGGPPCRPTATLLGFALARISSDSFIVCL